MKPITPSTVQSHAHFHRVAAALCVAAVAGVAAAPARADDAVIHLQVSGIFDRTAGSGKSQTENRAVGSFQAVTSRGAMKLVLRQSGREGLVLRGDDNILPLIETKVVDRSGVPTLEIGAKNGASFSSRNPVEATIDLITLNALTISGSGDVVGDALKAGSLKITISGSGNVRLKQLTADEVSTRVSGSGDVEFAGRTGRLAVSISGSGDVNSRALEADDVSVSVAGSGDANVTARKTLTVSIAGSGSVVYTGEATVKSSIAGHGSVTKQ